MAASDWLKDRLDKARGVIEREVEREALLAARRLSSGPFSLAELRRRGHPYSRRRPRPPMNPAIINRQSGQVYRGWEIRAKVQGLGVELNIDNRAPHYRFLNEGTERMMPRPVEAAIRREVAAVMPKIVGNVARRALGGR